MKKKDNKADIWAKAISTPSGYAECKLNMKLHPKQAQVLNSLFRDKRVVARTGNGIGKTSIIITAAVLYAIEILNATVVSTSATYRQITTQLVPNLKRYSHLFPTWTFLDNKISIADGTDRYIGFSSDQESNWQGYHGRPGEPLLIIIDEAAGVNEAVFKAVDRCNADYLLIVGSPLDPQGSFYDMETKPDISKYFKHYVIKQTDCTIEKGGWIKQSDIDMMTDKWGKDHVLVLSSVFAEFSSQSENSLISLSALDNCLKTPPQFNIGSPKRSVFIDVAAGGDSNVIALCKANRVSIVKKWKNKDTMAACGEILRELEQMRKDIGLKDTEVSIDADGLGIGIANRLQELGWKNINLFHGGSKPKSEEYLNAISEVWLTGIHKIQKCEIILPNDNDLKYQLLNRKLKIHSNGKLKLESKDDMKSRGVESPDVADAVLGAMYDHHTGFLKFAHALTPRGIINSKANFS